MTDTSVDYSASPPNIAQSKKYGPLRNKETLMKELGGAVKMMK